MQRNLDGLGCDHNAAFALLYLRTTEGIRAAIRAGEFSDRRAWNRVTLGDVFLGINAHVNRDLAFIYHRFGVTNRADHLQVNAVLARVQPVVLPEIVARLDPTLAAQVSNDPGLSLDIVAWRERAWKNAARLAAAPDLRARRAVAARIERHATRVARRIRAAFPATPAASRDRNAYCAEHLQQRPPQLTP